MQQQSNEPNRPIPKKMFTMNVKIVASSPSTSCCNYSSQKPFSLSSSLNPIRFTNSISSSQLQALHPLRSSYLAKSLSGSATTSVTSTMETGSVQEVLPPALDSTSEPPSVFDGTTRLYISYICPYAQRVWITRNCKGLQDKIKLVPIDLENRPAWYKEKVYSANKVPSLEHNNEVKGESLDLIKYIDSHFEGPSLFPDDPAKKEFAEELLSYTDSFNKSVIASIKGEGVEEAGAAFDYLETALSKFDDGPFFVGQFSLVDIAYAPFIERFKPFLFDVKGYGVTAGRPNLAVWIEEMDKIEGYKQTRRDPKELVEILKKRFSAQPLRAGTSLSCIIESNNMPRAPARTLHQSLHNVLVSCYCQS